MGMRKDLLDRYERLVRANTEQGEQLRQAQARIAELQSLAPAKPANWEIRLKEVERERDEARAEVEQLKNAEGVVSREAWEVTRKERDDALERHKQAHDQAMALHVVIDQAVHELRCLFDKDGLIPLGGGIKGRIQAAIRILTRDEVDGGAKSEVEVLRANAANWEAEAKERIDEVAGLENRMDAAFKLLEDYFRTQIPLGNERERVKQAMAILARAEEGDDPNIVREDGE